MKDYKKIIWVVVIAIVIIFGAKYIKSLNNPSFEKGAAPMAVTSGWNSIIANELNKSEIFLTVDGKPVPIFEKDLTVNNSKELFINVKRLKDVFSCLYFTRKKRFFREDFGNI